MSEDFENLERIDDIDVIEDNGFDTSEFKKSDYSVDAVEELIDVESGALIDSSNLTPMDYMRSIAKKLGQTIKDPKKNCKHCYGRGHVNYIAPNSKTTPIPCSCIYTKEATEAEENMPKVVNRQQRRTMDKMSNKIAKQYKKNWKNKGQEEYKKKVEIENASS